MKCRVMLFGSVDFGKTTIAKILTGKWLMTSSEEIKRNITIDLNIAEFTIYKGLNGYSLRRPTEVIGLKKFQLIDNPGHKNLFMTSLSGTFFTDILIILSTPSMDVSKDPYNTILQIARVQNIKVLFLQNKAELITNFEENTGKINKLIDQGLENYQEEFKIIPFSAITEENLEPLLEILYQYHTDTMRTTPFDSIFFEALKSFDVNRPQEITNPQTLKGAIIGGSNYGSTFKTNDTLNLITQKGVIFQVRIKRIFSGDEELEYSRLQEFLTVELSCEPHLGSRKGLIGSYLVNTTDNFRETLLLRPKITFLKVEDMPSTGLLVLGSRIEICTLSEESDNIRVYFKSKKTFITPFQVAFILIVRNHLWELQSCCELL